MTTPTFEFDEGCTDDEYAFVDVFGGASVVIHRTDDGLHAAIYPGEPSDPFGGPVTECYATWSELNQKEPNDD